MRQLLTTAMTMTAPLLLAGGLGLTSCAVDGCEVDPSDPRCVGVVTSDLTVVTNRLPKAGGGQLAVQVRNHSGTNCCVQATFGESGEAIKLNPPSTSDGPWTAAISGSTLSNFPLGAINVTVTDTTTNKSTTKALHLYSPATFPSNATQSLHDASRNPSWIGVGNGHMWATLDSATASNKRINEYLLGSGNMLLQAPALDQYLSLLPLSAVVTVSDTTAFTLNGTAMQELDTAPLETNSSFTMLKTFNLSKGNALAVDGRNTLLAVSGDGTDGPLKIFSIPQNAGDPLGVLTLNNVQTGKSVVAAAWGRINNDAQLDLVTLQSDKSFAVYLQGTTGFTYDQTFSTGLTTAAGTFNLPLAIAVGDVDLDALDDVMIAQDKQVWQLANEGNGTFIRGGTTSTPSSLVSGVGTDAIAVGDMNGDTKPDLVVASKSDGMLYFFPNQAQSQ